jgi:predicted nucleotidyltransferase
MGIKMPEMGNLNTSRSSRPDRRKVAATEPSPRTTMADALFTTTQQRVLGLLFGQPARSFYASELIELTGSGSGAVQRELQRLASSGLVTVKRIGNQKHYQANPEAPVYAELRGLVLKTVAFVEPIRRALEPLSAKIALAMLFGSVVKGTDTTDSDIDVLIVADGVTLEDIYSAMAVVEAELGRTISPTLYTQQEFEQRKASNNAFLARVLAGEHVVLLGSAV